MLLSLRQTLERWNQPWKRAAGIRIFRATLTVAVLTAMVKLAGGVKLVVIAYRFGTSDALEAFLLAFLLPAFAAEVIGASWTSALVPALIGARERRGHAAADRLLSETLLVGAALLGAAALLMLPARNVLLAIAGSGFAAEKRELAESMFLLMLPLPVLMGLSAMLRAVLTAGGRFAVAAAAPAATPLLTIALLAVVPGPWQARALAAGALVGSTVELALLFRALRGQGYSLLPRWRGVSPEFRQALGQYLPMAATTLLASGGPLIDQAMAASLRSGSLSMLTYGNKLVALMLAVGPVAVATAVLPQFSELAARGQYSRASAMLKACRRTVLIAAAPVALLLSYFSEPLVRLILERGAFSAADSSTVASVQSWYLLQIPFVTLNALAARMLSALKANSVLMRAAGFSLVVNVALDYLLMRWMGVAGIALASVFASLISFCYLSLEVRRTLARAAHL